MMIDIGLIRHSWLLVAPVAEKVTMHFYGRLFSEYPQVREMFPPAMDVQRDRLLKALTQVVLSLENGEPLDDYLGQLARDHRKYGVRPEHYPALGHCLVAAMRANAHGAWLPAYDEAWMNAYRYVAEVMIQAAEQDAVHAPPSWIGTVVSHEMRTRDIAVINVEPDQPYPFRAGQYATLQTGQWPKVWRSYSIANAPRHDNRLSFHVRAVPGGWVSTALVRHTQPGDIVLIGPPRGTFSLNDARTPHLVFLAGGTGLAPLKALVEESAWSPERPSIDLFHGVRHSSEAYDMHDLRRLRAQHKRLRIIQAVSDEPEHWPRHTAVDALEYHRVIPDGDVYVCGSPEMVRHTTARLLAMGVRGERVHSEFSGEAPSFVPS